MNVKQIEKSVIDQIALLLAPYEFKMSKIDLDREHYVYFERRFEDRSYCFSFRFLLYESKTIAIEPSIDVAYYEVTTLVKKVIKWESSYSDEWPLISVRTGALLESKNSDGFFNSNDCINVEFKPTDRGIQVAISELFENHFKRVALRFLEVTSSIEKLDELINGWVVGGGEPLKALVYFESHRPWQITSGLIVAKMMHRGDFKELLNRYLSFAKTKDPAKNKWIRDFYSFVDFFGSNVV